MKKSLLIAILFVAIPTLSSAANWKIIDNQSKIEFKATQNSSTITGSFKKFSGKIDFSPTQLETSRVEIEIDINSVEASLSDAAPTLKTAEWFSVKIFPKATFVANKFTKVSAKKFIADGILNIKGNAIATKLEFVLDEYSATKAHATGTTTINRSNFAIGAENPENAHGVQNEVVISFVIDAVK